MDIVDIGYCNGRIPAERGMSLASDERRRLARYHAQRRIISRLRNESGHSLLRDAMLGAVDGAITTFAVVAGSIGGGFSATVVIVLGMAGLLADGFSMAVSNYLSTKSERERLAQARDDEARHIDVVPIQQQDEVRQIFAEKGFNGQTLDQIVATITADRRLWIDTVVNEEFRLQLVGADPVRAGLATFAAFLLVGACPLAPFLIPGLSLAGAFTISSAVTVVAFLAVGMVKGRIIGASVWRSGLETLLTGSAAASLAFFVGYGIRVWVGPEWLAA